jgi:hypothetical protein
VFKVASVVRFPTGSDKASAHQVWIDTHEPKIAALRASGLQRCTFSRVLGPLPNEADLKKVYSPATESLFDGYANYWFADRGSFDEAVASGQWSNLLADAAPASDVGWADEMTAVVNEATIIEGPSEPYKVVWIVRFKPELTKDDAHHYWEFTHGPIVADAGISRYVQNHVAGPAGPNASNASAPDFDGFSECWFPDEQGFIDALATPQWLSLHEDRHHIFDMLKMWSAALEEHVLLG